MPVIVYQPSGHTTISGVNTGPNSHLCLSIFVLLCINPPLGLIAVCFSISSRHVAPMDWNSAHTRGKVALGIDIFGIVTSTLGVLVFVLIFYTKDNTT